MRSEARRLDLVIEGKGAFGERVLIGIGDGRFESADSLASPRRIEWKGGIVVPGLLNAHDHLDFNHYPRLGKGGYASFRHWMEDVEGPGDPALENFRRLPKEDRLLWGAYKNLLGGTTTVVHHNPPHPSFGAPLFPVRVVVTRWAHSLHLEKDPVSRFREGSHDSPFVIHGAEGVDEESRREVGRLANLGLLGPASWIVHGLALGPRELATIRDSGTGIIWCPSSNLFLYGKTLRKEAFGLGIPILLGTDSTASGQGDLLEELRIALATRLASREELFDMVTVRPAAALAGCESSRSSGRLSPGALADLVLLSSGNLFASSRKDLALVLREGIPLAGDPSFEPLFREAGVGFDRVVVDGAEKLVVAGLRALLERTRRRLPECDTFFGARIECR